MKKISTISLFIFGVIITSILTAGLVFYQNNKINQVLDLQAGNKVKNTLNQISSSGKSLVLDMTEISKHNKSSDCWMLINGRVYNITSFFGSHPGGNATMATTCGTDATDAYMTKDPNATSSSGGSNHSSGATSMLTSYFIGKLNQTIGTQNIVQTNAVVAPTRGGDED